MQGDYKTGRALVGIVEALGWVSSAGGLIMGLVAMSDRQPMAGLLVGGAVLLSGLVIVAMMQAVRAVFDTANSAAQMVALLKVPEGRAGATLAPAGQAVASGGGARMSAPPVQVGDLVETVNGIEIRAARGGFVVMGVSFSTLERARRHAESK